MARRHGWQLPTHPFQDETTTHLDPRRTPSTLDPDSTAPSDAAKKPPKSAVRLSAWKLAKLDASDATRAAARARASSSVLRPIVNPRTPNRPSHCSSSDGDDSTSSRSGGNIGWTQTAPLGPPLKSPYHTPSSYYSPINNFNPMYRSSTAEDRSPCSARTSDSDVGLGEDSRERFR
ncbi:putative S-acyltransferase [Acorus calamus]|uniref:S-acyltransferase n=1 Tax=Acorus calamus TaxID=4465 RepID=A0AAV9DUM8_ACOCL|nr:putative S-acyltransferase [Acorus calamus]